jgi:hypothetical protein
VQTNVIALNVNVINVIVENGRDAVSVIKEKEIIPDAEYCRKFGTGFRLHIAYVFIFFFFMQQGKACPVTVEGTILFCSLLFWHLVTVLLKDGCERAGMRSM